MRTHSCTRAGSTDTTWVRRLCATPSLTASGRQAPHYEDSTDSAVAHFGHSKSNVRCRQPWVCLPQCPDVSSLQAPAAPMLQQEDLHCAALAAREQGLARAVRGAPRSQGCRPRSSRTKARFTLYGPRACVFGGAAVARAAHLPLVHRQRQSGGWTGAAPHLNPPPLPALPCRCACTSG